MSGIQLPVRRVCCSIFLEGALLFGVYIVGSHKESTVLVLEGPITEISSPPQKLIIDEKGF